MISVLKRPSPSARTATASPLPPMAQFGVPPCGHRRVGRAVYSSSDSGGFLSPPHRCVRARQHTVPALRRRAVALASENVDAVSGPLLRQARARPLFSRLRSGASQRMSTDLAPPQAPDQATQRWVLWPSPAILLHALQSTGCHCCNFMALKRRTRALPTCAAARLMRGLSCSKIERELDARPYHLDRDWYLELPRHKRNAMSKAEWSS